MTPGPHLPEPRLPPHPPLVIAVTPYHLATQEVPALCALLLADRVLTLMPEPAAGTSRDDVALAMRRSPRFLRFMERIRWSVPLWDQGVISAADGERSLASSLAETYQDIFHNDRFASLRPLIASATSASPDDFLDRLCADLLKGGPNPAFSVPVSACIDAFAAEHDLPVARAAPSSIAQQAESRLLRRRAAIVLPVLVQASGHRILSLRLALEPELREVRAALVDTLTAETAQQSASPSVPDTRRLDTASKRLAARFEDLRSRLAQGDDDRGIRVVHAYASVTIMAAPIDAVLRSSAIAARSTRKQSPSSLQVSAPAAASGVETDRPTLTVLVIKSINLRPAFHSPATDS